MKVSITGPYGKWYLKRFLRCLAWTVLWCGLALGAIEFFYGPGADFASAQPYLMGGISAVLVVAVLVSLGFFLGGFFSLLGWKGRLKKQIRRYLSPEEPRDPIQVVEEDLKCRLFGISEIFLGREWVTFPGQAMKRDAIVGIYFTELSRSSSSKKMRITLVDEKGEQISYEDTPSGGPADYNFLVTMHPWAAHGDYREYTFFLRKEGDQPDRRKLRRPQTPYQLGVSRWDRSPVLEANPIEWEYERWLLASYAPYIVGDPYRHGDFDHVGGWERTALQQKIAEKDILEEMWEVTDKEELLSTVGYLTGTGKERRDGWQLGRGMMVLAFGYIAGYLTRWELLWYSLQVGEAIQQTFSGWKELHESYLKSYEEWAKDYKRSVGLRRKGYEALMKDPGSILNTVPFGMNLQGRCREALRSAAGDGEILNELNEL